MVDIRSGIINSIHGDNLGNGEIRQGDGKIKSKTKKSLKRIIRSKIGIMSKTDIYNMLCEKVYSRNLSVDTFGKWYSAEMRKSEQERIHRG